MDMEKDKRYGKIISAIDEAYNELDEITQSGYVATQDDLATLVVSDGVATVVFPDQSRHRIEYRDTTDLIAKIQSMGYAVVNNLKEPIGQVIRARRPAAVPLVRRLGPRVRPVISRPAPALPEPARTYNEVEIIRRLVKRRLKDTDIKCLCEVKPLNEIVSSQGATVFNFNKSVSFNAVWVWLAKITRIVIETNVDFMYYIQEIVNNFNDWRDPKILLSKYGDGSISLDMAVELLMDSIRYGEFEVLRPVGKEPIFTIHALGLQYDRPKKIPKNLFTNTTYIPEHSKYINRSAMIIFHNIPHAYISFDIYRYVKTVGIDREDIIAEYGKPFPIINFKLSKSKFDDRLISYFANSDDNKRVRGYMEVSIIALVFSR